MWGRLIFLCWRLVILGLVISYSLLVRREEMGLRDALVGRKGEGIPWNKKWAYYYETVVKCHSMKNMSFHHFFSLHVHFLLHFISFVWELLPLSVTIVNFPF
jgi:hypothetical protein